MWNKASSVGRVHDLWCKPPLRVMDRYYVVGVTTIPCLRFGVVIIVSKEDNSYFVTIANNPQNMHMPDLYKNVLYGSEKERETGALQTPLLRVPISMQGGLRQQLYSCSNVYLQWGRATTWIFPCCWTWVVLLLLCSPPMFWKCQSMSWNSLDSDIEINNLEGLSNNPWY